MSDLTVEMARLSVCQRSTDMTESTRMKTKEPEVCKLDSPPLLDLPLSPRPIKSPKQTHVPPSPHLRPSNPPLFLTAALLRIFADAIHSSRIPIQFHLVAEALAQEIPGSNTPKWRIEARNETNTWPKVGERRTVRLIVWGWAAEGVTPPWAGEIMVRLLVSNGGVGQIETVAWRLGPEEPQGAGKTARNEWDDWRTLHFQRYFAIQVEYAGVEVGGGTKEIVRIQLAQGKSMMLDSVVDLVFRAVKKALGKPFKPERQELKRVMGRMSKRLEGEGKKAEKVVVTRGFRASESNGTYIPAAFVEIHCHQPGVPKIEEKPASTGEKSAAVLIVDVWANGKMKLIGVMYAGEEPVMHTYRSRFPPPDTSNIDKGVAARRLAYTKKEQARLQDAASANLHELPAEDTAEMATVEMKGIPCVADD